LSMFILIAFILHMYTVQASRTQTHLSVMTVTEIFDKTFPQLELYIQQKCPENTLPPSLRPLIGHLGMKHCNLWSMPQIYLWMGVNERVCHSTGMQECRNITLDDLYEKVKNGNAYAKVVLKDILQGEQRINITCEEDAATGCFTPDPTLRRRLNRMDEYSIDSIGHTNADKAARNQIFHAPVGRHGICNKESPSNPVWTPGLFIMTCTCSRKTVLAICFMAYSESPWYFFLLMRNRFNTAPSIVYYDNACHLQLYCMHREWEYFFNTVFICDRFHQWNHTTCCHRFRTASHRSMVVQVANTQAVEQFNHHIKDRTWKSVRFMTLRNAVSYLSVFIVLNNIEAQITTG
jgi:hypothetical protein